MTAFLPTPDSKEHDVAAKKKSNTGTRKSTLHRLTVPDVAR
ncbi:hypothetical protein ACWDDN_37040 [Streptomyces griseoruber]